MRRWIAAFFFLSGFCGLTYQIIWLRLAFSQFGIITPVLSIVLSTFMLGLALGSWIGGKYSEAWAQRSGISAIYFYALNELLIGVGAFVVPGLFRVAGKALLEAGEMNSLHFLVLSAVALSTSILPWCILMGATFPLMMAFLKQEGYPDSLSFSFLYTANVFGALFGTVATAVALIELFGFKATLIFTGSLNFSIAIVSAMVAAWVWRTGPLASAKILASAPPRQRRAPTPLYAILFLTGFIAMALEVVWTRAFTMILKTSVYAFALVLSVYLLATWTGSLASRRWRFPYPRLFPFLSISAFLPIFLNDPRFPANPLRVALSLFPICGCLGYLTPHLIDEISQGHPDSAGRAYAFNTLGCILGPLFASYALLPQMGVRVAMILLALPFLGLMIAHEVPRSRERALGTGLLALALVYSSVALSLSYEEGFYLLYRQPIFRRDYTATVVSCGAGMRKQLFVNGIPMTNQSPITKAMAHLPLGLLSHKPTSALMICFGMGTTFRSILTWNIRTVSVELVPSVKDAFPYYFDDYQAVMNNPLGQIIVDDGRRFMSRSKDRFDVITLDPPPPIESAGSSLLYSKEFYELAKQRLAPGGILQQWIPSADADTFHAATRSLVQSFPYLKVFKSTGGFGYHFLASMTPIEIPSVEDYIERLSPKARADLMEWETDKSLKTKVDQMLHNEQNVKDFLSNDPSISISDDRPHNEYFLLHQAAAKNRGTFRIIR